MSPASEQARPAAPPVYQEIPGMIAVAAAASYMVSYVLQERFFDYFGLSVEQVGIDRTGALLRLAPAMLKLFFVLALVLGLAFALAGLAWILGLSGRRSRWIRFRYVLVGALPLGMLMVNWMFGDLWTGQFDDGATGESAWWGILFIALFFLPTALIVYSRARRWFGVLVVLSLFTLFGVLGFISVTSAASSFVATGQDPGILRSIGIKIRYMRVQWVDQQRVPPSIAEELKKNAGSREIVLVALNVSSTQYAFYDCRTRLAHAVPVGDVVVERLLVPKGGERDYPRMLTGCAPG